MNPKITIAVDTKNKAIAALTGLVTVGAKVDVEITGLPSGIPNWAATDRWCGPSVRFRVVDEMGRDLVRFPLVEKSSASATDGDQWTVESQGTANEKYKTNSGQATTPVVNFDTDVLRKEMYGLPFDAYREFGLILDSTVDAAQYAIGKIKVRQWATCPTEDPTVLPNWKDEVNYMIEHIMADESMESVPTQRQLTVALKKVWQKLGGTFTLCFAALCACGDVTRSTAWQDVPPDTVLSTVVDMAHPSGMVTDVRTNGVTAVVGGVANINITGGGGGITEAQAGTIATNTVDAKVAPWAMSGQPKPEGISPSAVTNIASSAAVTNAGAVASAKAYADGKFLPFTGGTMISDGSGDAILKFPETTSSDDCTAIDLGQRSIVLDGETGSNLRMSGGDYIVYFKIDSGDEEIKTAFQVDGSDLITENYGDNRYAKIVSSATSGNFAALTSSGNLADSTYSPSSFAPAVEGGYLPIILKSADPIVKLYYDENEFGRMCYAHCDTEGEPYEYFSFGFDSGRTVFDITEHDSYAFRVGGNENGESWLTPDGTDIMTLGQADFHIVTTTTVTSGQIGNFNITNLTAKTISCSVSETSGKSSDILIWTYGNTAECQMTFTLPSGFTLVGDAADTKASANKRCLFSLVKISNTEVIVSKKEYN